MRVPEFFTQAPRETTPLWVNFEAQVPPKESVPSFVCEPVRPAITTALPPDSWTLGRNVAEIVFAAPALVELSLIVRVDHVETPAPRIPRVVSDSAGIVVPPEAAIVGVTAACAALLFCIENVTTVSLLLGTV